MRLLFSSKTSLEDLEWVQDIYLVSIFFPLPQLSQLSFSTITYCPIASKPSVFCIFLLTFAIHQTPNCIKHREQVVQPQVSSKAIPKESHQCLSLLQSFICVWTCSTSVFIVEIIFQWIDHIFPYFHYIPLYHQSFKPSHHLGSCISSASIELKIFYNYKTTNELDWR